MIPNVTVSDGIVHISDFNNDHIADNTTFVGVHTINSLDHGSIGPALLLTIAVSINHNALHNISGGIIINFGMFLHITEILDPISLIAIKNGHIPVDRIHNGNLANLIVSLIMVDCAISKDTVPGVIRISTLHKAAHDAVGGIVT